MYYFCTKKYQRSNTYYNNYCFDEDLYHYFFNTFYYEKSFTFGLYRPTLMF